MAIEDIKDLAERIPSTVSRKSYNHKEDQVGLSKIL